MPMSNPQNEKNTPTKPREGQRCVGDLCWNPDTGKLEFTFDQKTCPIDVLKHLAGHTPMVIKEKEDPKSKGEVKE